MLRGPGFQRALELRIRAHRLVREAHIALEHAFGDITPPEVLNRLAAATAALEEISSKGSQPNAEQLLDRMEQTLEEWHRFVRRRDSQRLLGVHDEHAAREAFVPEGPCVRVHVTDAAKLETFYLRDIGGGGMFLRATHTLPVSSHLFLALVMPDGVEIKICCRVVHLRSPQEATVSHPSGMGVQFVDLTSEVRQKIASYVECLRRLKKAPGS